MLSWRKSVHIKYYHETSDMIIRDPFKYHIWGSLSWMVYWFFFSSERMVYWTLKYHKIDFLTLIDRPFSWKKDPYKLAKLLSQERKIKFTFFDNIFFICIFLNNFFFICIKSCFWPNFYVFLWLSWGGWVWRERFMKNVSHFLLFRGFFCVKKE